MSWTFSKPAGERMTLISSRHPVAVSSISIDPRVYRLGRLAVISLHTELVCAPKPGLVTPYDSGSHSDMDATTFMRSLFALRSYFVAIAIAGYRHAGFAELNRLGRDAEIQMLYATGGINTHRGAIFSLGLLVAGAAALHSSGVSRPTGNAVCIEVARRWGHELSAAPPDPASHGQRVACRYGVGGARLEAIRGFPVLRQIALPGLRAGLAAGLETESALIDTLMRLVAVLDDTNLLHRGGAEGLEFAQTEAQGFIADGGCHADHWRVRLAKLSDDFIARRLSPGGSADLLACGWFLNRLEVS